MRKLLLAISVISLLGACSSGQAKPQAAATKSVPGPAGSSSQPADTSSNTVNSASAAGSDGPITADPCSLLTSDEVAAVLGGPATSNAGSGLSGGASCTWTFHQSSAGFATLNLELLTSELCATERKLQESDAIVHAAGNTLYTDIGEGGLADGSAIDVVTKAGCFHIDGPDDPAAVVAAARAVAAHLR